MKIPPKILKKLKIIITKEIPKDEGNFGNIKLYSYDGMPKNELWLFTDKKFYKMILQNYDGVKVIKERS